MRERADDDVTYLYEQGAQRYANTYVDGQVLKTIKTFVFIGRTFLGPTPSTEYINTDCEETFNQHNKNISEDNHLCHL